MSDDTPLGDLREQMEEAETGSSSGGSEEDSEESESVDDGSGSGGSDVGGEDVPGFEFGATKQKPLYPRQGTWELYDDLRFEVESELRSRGIRNLESREVDDALLRFAAENPGRVAELVLEERGSGSGEE